MTNVDIAQIIGSGVLALAALGIFWIASGRHWMCLYGRAVLVAVGMYVASTVVVRLLVVPFDVLGQQDARTVNGFTPIPFMLIMVQLVIMHALTTKQEEEEGVVPT